MSFQDIFDIIFYPLKYRFYQKSRVEPEFKSDTSNGSETPSYLNPQYDYWKERVFSVDQRFPGPSLDRSVLPNLFCKDETTRLHRCLIRHNEDKKSCNIEWYASFDCIEPVVFGALSALRCPVLHEELQKCLAGPKPTIDWGRRFCRAEKDAFDECGRLRALPQVVAWLEEGIDLPLLWRNLQLGA